MRVYLGPISSLRYWRSDDPYRYGDLLIERMHEDTLIDCAYTIKDIEQINLWGLASNDQPLDIVVPKASMRTKTNKLTTTVLSHTLPDGAFCCAFKNVYVCSPELTFILLAGQLSFFPLLKIAYELCGSFSLDHTPVGFFCHDPLATAADIKEMLREFPRLKGVRLASRVLEHVVDNTRSPGEADLSIMFGLPSKLRGFGLGSHTSNTTLTVSPRLQSQTILKEITPDLYWDDKGFCVEYESTAFHGAASMSNDPRVRQRENRVLLAKDSRRRRTYDVLKLKAITVTAAEFSDFEELTQVATVIGRHMGLHGLNRKTEIQDRRKELHSWLKWPRHFHYKAPSAGTFDAEPTCSPD